MPGGGAWDPNDALPAAEAPATFHLGPHVGDDRWTCSYEPIAL
jgi:hypothetical protein